jgi:hypothetical protein
MQYYFKKLRITQYSLVTGLYKIYQNLNESKIQIHGILLIFIDVIAVEI